MAQFVATRPMSPLSDKGHTQKEVTKREHSFVVGEEERECCLTPPAIGPPRLLAGKSGKWRGLRRHNSEDWKTHRRARILCSRLATKKFGTVWPGVNVTSIFDPATSVYCFALREKVFFSTPHHRTSVQSASASTLSEENTSDIQSSPKCNWLLLRRGSLSYRCYICQAFFS